MGSGELRFVVRSVKGFDSTMNVMVGFECAMRELLGTSTVKIHVEMLLLMVFSISVNYL